MTVVVAYWFGITLGLVAVNALLREFAKRSPPEHLLRRRVQGGVFDMEAWNYFVSFFVQAVALPGLILLSYYQYERDDWWFVGQRHTVEVLFAATMLGYYASDTIFNWGNLDVLIKVHHIMTCVVVWLCVVTNGWRGMNMSVAAILELGSAACGLVDLGLLQRTVGCGIMIATSVFVPGLIVHAFIAGPPPIAMFIAVQVFVLIACAMRINSCVGYIKTPAGVTAVGAESAGDTAPSSTVLCSAEPTSLTVPIVDRDLKPSVP